MKIILFTFILLGFYGFSQNSEESILRKRAIHAAELMDSTSGILNQDEIEHFQGVDYFDFDSTFQITAKFTKSKGKKFKMPTTTERMPVYRRYGYIDFMVGKDSVRLTVYQNIELKKSKKYRDYLFIPFRDGTSRNETYGGGRYLDIRIPESDSILIDFNLAYNPYCAYSYRYSCPVPPEENTISVKIIAGEKNPIGH